MKKPKNVLEYALEKSREIEIKKKSYQRVYAVITDRRGRILCEASNSYDDSNAIQRSYANNSEHPEKKFAHAECRALQKLGRNKEKAYKITIARTLKDGSSALAKPCCICTKAISGFELKSVEYSV